MLKIRHKICGHIWEPAWVDRVIYARDLNNNNNNNSLMDARLSVIKDKKDFIFKKLEGNCRIFCYRCANTPVQAGYRGAGEHLNNTHISNWELVKENSNGE